MSSTFFVFIFASCLAFAWPLCTPDEWEGFEGSVGGYASRDGPGLIKEYLSIHYDYTNGRSVVFLDYVNGQYENKYKMLVIADKEKDKFKMYVLDTKDDSCWVKTYDKPFRRICIPDDAKHVGDYSLGPKGVFPLSAYEISKDAMFISMSVYVDGDVIIPVSETVLGYIRGVHFLQNVGFLDITPGIRNASVFDIPAECKVKEDFTMREELTRQHYILAL